MSYKSKNQKVVRSYHFFIEKEKSKAVFTAADIEKATGWVKTTVRTYLTKKWDKLLEKKDSGFIVKHLPYTLEEYERMMSQKDRLSNDPTKPDLQLEVERMVIKAREAAILALDIYNRPAALFKSEGFIVMMVIAWTALFHAIFEKRNINYYHLKSDGSPEIIDGDKKAWELRACIKEFYGSSTNPIRINLEFILELRNKIEHRFVPAIDLHVAGECQALLLNFEELLTQKFGDYYALKEYLSVPLQTSSVRTASQAEALRKFQGKQYDDIKDYIDTYRSELSPEIYEDSRFSFRVFLIPKSGNHAATSDLAFEFIKYDPDNPEEFERLNKQITLIREKRVPVANPGKHKPSSVAKIVEEKIGMRFNIYNHTQAWKHYGVRQSGETPEGCNPKYCQFDEVHKDYIYTQEWIDFLVQKLSDKSEYDSVTSITYPK